MSNTELTTKAREYRELQAEIKVLQEQADALKAVMVNEMDTRMADSVQAGEYTIRYSAYQTTRVDTSKLKAAGLYDQYSRTSAAVRFTVQ